MIQLSITRTCKRVGRGADDGEGFSTFSQDLKTFGGLQSAKDWLKETYGTCKRVKIFNDTQAGTIHCGYVYQFKSEEWNGNTGKREWFFQHHWVTFSELKDMDLDKVS